MKTNIKHAMSIMGVAALYLFLITFAPVSEIGNEHAKTIVGFILGSALSCLLNYYWGSSKKYPTNPEFPEMDRAVKDGTEKLQAEQVKAVEEQK